MQKFLIPLSLLLSLMPQHLFAAAVHRGGAELLNPKAYSIEAAASVFTTSGHYDVDGLESSLDEGASYRMIDSDFKLSYGLSSNIETSLFAKIRSVNSNDGTTTATNTGPESAGVEAKYAFEPSGNLRYAMGLRYRQTFYTNSVYTSAQIPPSDEVILGDDGSEYGVDFYATYRGHPWLLDLKLGYNSPPNNLSSEVVYKAEGLYQMTKLALFLGVEGIYSLKRDQYTDTPAQKPLMSTGESALFNSLNRENIRPYLGLNYAFTKFLLTMKGQTVISGKSTDKGTLGLIGISWNSEGVTPDSVKIESFKEYHIDGSVLKVSARGNFIKIDQGLSTDVEKGAKFDIYQTDYFGGNVLVGTGVVFEVGSDWAVIKLVKKYKEIEIKPGFAARGF